MQFWFFCFCLFFVFLGLHAQHMEVLRLGVELELQLLAYAKGGLALSACPSLGAGVSAVSYTHLTLPTICSV